MLENTGKPRTQCGKTCNLESKGGHPIHCKCTYSIYIERHLNILGIGGWEIVVGSNPT